MNEEVAEEGQGPQTALEIDITPTVRGSLRAQVVANLSWKACLAELIDNAFDAGSPNVRLEFGPGGKYLRVVDTGSGFADLKQAVRLGRHDEHASTRLGRYGVGLNDASLWIGSADSVLRIETIAKRRYHFIRIDWAALGERDNWRLPADAYRERAAADGETGSIIHIEPCNRAIPEGERWSDLERDLSYLFAPGMEAGKQITIQSKVASRSAHILRPPEEPRFSETVEGTIVVGERTVLVRAGILQAGESCRWAGMTYVSGHRVIKEAGIKGCGGMNYDRLVGRATLDRQWKLTRNKDDFAEHAEALYGAVFEVIRPLLEKIEQRARKMSWSDTLASTEQRLNQWLAPGIETENNAKATRTRTGQKSGTVEPKGTPRRHRQAARPQPGHTFMIQPGIQVKIVLADLEGATLGQADYDRELNCAVVRLNQNQPVVMRAVKSNDDVFLALVTLGPLYDRANAENGGDQPFLPGIQGSRFAEEVGAMFARGLAMDGMPVGGRVSE